MPMHFVYILERLGSTERYIGYTQNVVRRLEEHNQGHTHSTKHARWNLVYYEAYLHKMDALGREKFLKSGSGWRFMKKQLRHYLEDSVRPEHIPLPPPPRYTPPVDPS